VSRWGYFVKRLALAVPVLSLVITFLFIMLRLGPIDPVSAIIGPQGSGSEVQAIRQQLGLDRPLWDQYVQFATDLLTFQGQSWVVQQDRPVREVIASSGPPTVWLGFWSILLPLFIGIPLGFYAGLNPNSKADYLASVSGIVWQAMPNFWLAILALAALRQTNEGFLIRQLGVSINWYTLGPNVESITGTPDLDFFNWAFLWGGAGFDFSLSGFLRDTKRILPGALILGSASIAAELRIGRTAMLETIHSNYVETARAKGLKSRTIVWKHIFRNALIPLVPIITNEAFLLIGGSVIIEQIFNINGLGRTFFQAIIQGDLPLAGSLLFMFTLLLLLLNILQDFLYTVIDPRVGYEQ